VSGFCPEAAILSLSRRSSWPTFEIADTLLWPLFLDRLFAAFAIKPILALAQQTDAANMPAKAVRYS
jgi:hypothetical protein